MTQPARTAPAPIVEFPMLLVLDEKHEPIHFLVTTDQELFALALRIVRARLARRWYSGEGDKEALSIAEGLGSEGRRAWEFLRKRRLYEYESVVLAKFDTEYP